MTRNSWRIFFILFALSLVTRSVPMLIKHTWKPENRAYLYETDSPGYEGLGIQTLEQGWTAAQDTSRTPFYPGFIAAIYAVVGQNPYWVIVMQILLMALGSGILFLIGEAMGERKAGLLAGLIWVFAPAAMIYTNLIYTEPLFTVIALLGTLILIHSLTKERPATGAIVAGVLFGLATLTRPIGTYIPYAMALAFVIAPKFRLRRGLILAALFIGTYAAVLTPRLHWMKQATGRAMISGMYDHNFHEIYDYMNFYLPSVRPFDEAHPHLLYQIGRAICGKHIDSVLQAYSAKKIHTIAEDCDFWQAMATERVLRYPGVFTKMYAKGLSTLFLAPASNDFFNALNLSGNRIEFGVRSGTSYAQNMRDLLFKKSLFQILYIVLGFLFSLVVYGFFIVGAWRLWKEGRRPEYFILILPLVIFTIFIGTHGTLRYREPMEPFILLIAAIGYERWKAKKSEGAVA